MKKITKPPKVLVSLLSNKENENNLQEWINLLISPFENKAFATDCFKIASVLEKGTKELLFNPDKDLVRIDFPTTVSGLYFKTDEDYSHEGYLVLSIENRATIHFVTNKHSIIKYEQRFKGKSKEISGTYEEIAKIYLEYINDLIAVPKVSK